MTAEEAIRERIEETKKEKDLYNAKKLLGVDLRPLEWNYLKDPILQLEWVLSLLKTDRMALAKRLDKIASIIEAVDNRCAAVDGPVSPTLKEMTQVEISEIYKLAKLESKSEMR